MTQTILVVDDEAALTEVLANILEYQGYAVLTAPDGLEALKLIRQNQIDLLICDYMMPNLNGLALYHRLINEKIAPSMPIIMMSALPDALSALPIHAVLKKPFHADELVAHVKKALDTGHQPAH